MFSVAGIVLVISMGWRFSGYLDQAAEGLLAREILFALMAYRLPSFLELIIPVSFYLAVMLAYGRLYADNEMAVLQSTGMSPWKLMGLTLLMALAVMLLTAVVTLWLKPMGEQRVEAMLLGQKNLTELDTLAAGRFQTFFGGRRVTYTEDINGEGELSRVFINEYRENHRENKPQDAVTIVADSGSSRIDDAGQRFLVLYNGARYRGVPGEEDYQIVTYEEYGQLVDKGSASATKKRQAAVPTPALLGVKEPGGVAELHWRISVVLMVPVLALLAIPLARVNPKQGRFMRLVPAMILCFLYMILLSIARSGLERGQVPLVVGLWWVHGIFLVITLLAYRLEPMVARVSRLLYPVRRAAL